MRILICHWINDAWTMDNAVLCVAENYEVNTRQIRWLIHIILPRNIIDRGATSSKQCASWYLSEQKMAIKLEINHKVRRWYAHNSRRMLSKLMTSMRASEYAHSWISVGLFLYLWPAYKCAVHTRQLDIVIVSDHLLFIRNWSSRSLSKQYCWFYWLILNLFCSYTSYLSFDFDFWIFKLVNLDLKARFLSPS